MTLSWNNKSSVVADRPGMLSGLTYYIQLYEWFSPGWALIKGWQVNHGGQTPEPPVPAEIFAEPLPYRCAVLWLWLPTGHAQGGDRWMHSANSCNYGDYPGSSRHWS